MAQVVAGMSPAQVAIHVRTLSKELAKQMGNIETPKHDPDDEEYEGDDGYASDYDPQTGVYAHDAASGFAAAIKMYGEVAVHRAAYRQEEKHLRVAIEDRKAASARGHLNAMIELREKERAALQNAYYSMSDAVQTFQNLYNKSKNGGAKPVTENARKLAEQIYEYAMALPTHDAPAVGDLEITMRAIIAILRARHPQELEKITQENIGIMEEVNDNAQTQPQPEQNVTANVPTVVGAAQGTGTSISFNNGQ